MCKIKRGCVTTYDTPSSINYCCYNYRQILKQFIILVIPYRFTSVGVKTVSGM